MRKPAFCIRENKGTDQLHSNCAFVFAEWIIQSLYLLDAKFQASNHLLLLYSSLCATRAGQKPEDMFSHYTPHILTYLSHVMRKPTFYICENKDADQLRGDREADQRLCFRYTDSTFPLLSKSEIASLYPSSVAVQSCLCWTRSETRMLVFS